MRFRASLLLCLLPLSLYAFGQTEPLIIQYPVSLIHPGISETDSVSRVLQQVKRSAKQANQFYMEVETVVCGDEQCRIDTILIYWDELGFYEKIILPAAIELEKAEGESFTQADYEKLNRVLSDRNSTIRDVRKRDIVGTESSEGMDAISAATIALDKKDYVEGAVWTCYTLWHWANGDVRQAIRNISGEAKSQADLLGYLFAAVDSQIYALTHLIRRKSYEAATVEAVYNCRISSDYELLKLMIKYAEAAPVKQYFSILSDYIATEYKQLRIMSLQSLLESSSPASIVYYEGLIEPLSHTGSFHEISLFLNILEQKKLSSPKLRQALFSLLAHDNFVLARRVYWFLSEQELTETEQQELTIFYQKNADSL